MPYRRLPKTDLTRLSALRIAISKGEKDGINNQIIPMKLQHEAKNLLMRYEQSLFDYKQSIANQRANANKYRNNTKLARLYLSHFIQVVNLAIIRGELKKSVKSFYGLDEDADNVPNLSSDKLLLAWGEKIITGESERTKHGGAPIYNPNIAKVKVYYDIFKENQTEQAMFLKNIKYYAGILKDLRDKCDALIFEIWNDVEAQFINLPWHERIKKCSEYGLIYYLRRGEDMDNLTS